MTLVGDDPSEAEGSIAVVESKGRSLLELKSVGSGADESKSVDVNGGESWSSDVGVGVSNVPVPDENASVSVESSDVGVGVGSGVSSKEVKREGVDGGMAVGVSVEKVENGRW